MERIDSDDIMVDLNCRTEDALTIESSSSSLDGAEGEKVEVQLLLSEIRKCTGTLASAPIQPIKTAKVRSLQSSRACSIFDGCVTDTEVDEAPAALVEILSSSQSSESALTSDHMDTHQMVPLNDVESSAFETTLTRFTESIATYLCSGGVDDDDITLMRLHTKDSFANQSLVTFQTEQTQVSTTQTASDTYMGRILCATMTCNDSALCTSSAVPPAITSPRNSTCTGADLSDIRQAVEDDISTVLGSSSVNSNGWLPSLGAYWFNSQQSTVGDGDSKRSDRARRKKTPTSKRRLRNRCGNRSTQSARLRHLWYRWHCQSATEGNSPVEIPSWAHHLGNTKSMDDLVVHDIQKSESTDNELMDLCYDSDPETFLRSPRSAPIPPRTPVKRDFKETKNRPTLIDTNASYGSIFERPPPPVFGGNRQRPALSFDTRSFDTCGSALSIDADESNALVPMNISPEVADREVVRVSAVSPFNTSVLRWIEYLTLFFSFRCI